jgi:SAM-dependent methyltransferase
MGTVFNDFSEAYDVMFPWEKRMEGERKFYGELFEREGVTSVLDCACGTGRHAVLFARLGLRSAGSDLSPEMIKAARRMALTAGVPLDLRVSSFTELSRNFQPSERYDAVVCVGNSLTLAPTDDDVALALREMHGRLNDGGIAVLHIFNWDRVVREKIRIMPASRGMLGMRDLTFLRVFSHDDEGIRLQIVVMERKEEGVETTVLTARQRPVGPELLLRYLKEAGFGQVECYADQRLNPFDAEASDNLWVVARRG